MTDTEFEECLQEETTGDLAAVLGDIWIEDPQRGVISDLDKNDIVLHIVKHVDRGVKDGSWTYKSWLDEIADTYF